MAEEKVIGLKLRWMKVDSFGNAIVVRKHSHIYRRHLNLKKWRIADGHGAKKKPRFPMGSVSSLSGLGSMELSRTCSKEMLRFR